MREEVFVDASHVLCGFAVSIIMIIQEIYEVYPKVLRDFCCVPAVLCDFALVPQISPK